MTQTHENYEEWLTTIANTRLLYNTMEELEDMLDNHSIRSNGIKRSFTSMPKMRAAFRDLKVEVELMTEGQLDLEGVLTVYQHTWQFFRRHLNRRTHPERVVTELLSYCYPPYNRKGLGAKRATIYQQIVEQGVNVPMLVMLLLKVMPGPDSKEGDVADMPQDFERVMKLLEEFTSNATMFTLLPAITRAREERAKTRITLLYHISQILGIYESYAEQRSLYDISSDMKANSVSLDIDGFWNECGGRPLYTEFWQMETLGEGTYFMTHWRKDAEGRLTGIRYTLFLIEANDGGIIYYLLHPETIRHRMKGLAYDDVDHVWYRTEMLDATPARLPLQRLMLSECWPQKIDLTRCTDEEVVGQYERWLQECEIVRPYQHLEYSFNPDIYAITKTHIYIPTDREGEYFKVPKAACEGFERIQMTDKVGTMLMDGRMYLVFDEFMLYIPTTRSTLKRYGIERVCRIE